MRNKESRREMLVLLGICIQWRPFKRYRFVLNTSRAQRMNSVKFMHYEVHKMHSSGVIGSVLIGPHQSYKSNDSKGSPSIKLKEKENKVLTGNFLTFHRP